MDGWIEDFLISLASMATVVLLAWIFEMLLGIPRENFVECVILVFVFMTLFRIRRHL